MLSSDSHPNASNAVKSWLPLVLQIMVVVFGLGMFKAQIDGRFSLIDQQFTIQRALIDNDLLKLQSIDSSIDTRLQQIVDLTLDNRDRLERHAVSIQENSICLSTLSRP